MFSIFLCAVVVWPLSVRDGLVAYYPFNGNANDESGHGNNGENHGVQFAADKFGIPASAAFWPEKSCRWIDIPVSPELEFGEGDFSISMWLYIPIQDPTYQHKLSTMILSWNALVTSGWHRVNHGIRIQADTQKNFGSPGYVQFATEALHNISFGPDLNYIWKSFVFSRSNDANLSMYIDGDLVESYRYPVDNVTHSSCRLGSLLGYPFIWPNCYSGYMDEISFFNRSLTEDEIQKLYHDFREAPPTSTTTTTGVPPISATITTTTTTTSTSTPTTSTFSTSTEKGSTSMGTISSDHQTSSEPDDDAFAATIATSFGMVSISLIFCCFLVLILVVGVGLLGIFLQVRRIARRSHVAISNELDDFSLE